MAISSVLGSSALLPAGLGFRNVIINGNFDVWQRGTSTFSNVSSGSFSSDRAYNSYTGTSVNMNVSRDAGVPNFRSKYSIKYQQLTSNATSVTEYAYRQYIEGTNAFALYGKTVTLSFWYKSNKTGSHGVRIYGAYATGGADFTTTFIVSLADTWEYKTITTAVPFSSITANPVAPTDPGAMCAIGFCVASGVGFSSISANDYFQISQMQLEQNYQPTPFEQRPIGVELALCQRYFYQINAATSQRIALGFQETTTGSEVMLPIPVPMRSVPAPTYTGGLCITDGIAFNQAITALTTVYSYNFPVTLGLTHGAVGSVRAPVLLSFTSAGTVALSAEL